MVRMLAIVLLALTPPVGAQQAADGVITGIVRDDGGGVIPGTTITATLNGKSSTAVTNAKGEYTVVGLERGSYRVTAQLTGFRTATCELVNVAASVANCDLILQIGGPPIPRTDPRYQALEAAESRWRASRIPSYEYGVSVACFCGFDRRPFAIRVIDGKPEPLTDDDRWRRSAAEHYNTIEKLFARVRVALDRGYELIDVSYDATRGRPLVISLDMSRGGADDDVLIVVSGFTPITIKGGDLR